MANENLQALQKQREEKARELELEKQAFSYDKLAEMTGFKNEMLMVLHKSVAKDTTPAEFAYFLNYAKSVGLNPLNKEVWCYKNSKGDVLIFTGRDGFLKKNKENPLYRGMRSSDVCQFDEFEIDMIEGKVNHKITNNRGKVIGAYAIVSIEGQKDTIVYLDFEEYDLGQARWKTAPKSQIKKCAQSQALRESAGMTGIQNEEAFRIKNGIAYSAGERPADEIIPHTEVKTEERLLKFIEMARTNDDLLNIESECTSTETAMAYSKKWKELNHE